MSVDNFDDDLLDDLMNIVQNDDLAEDAQVLTKRLHKLYLFFVYEVMNKINFHKNRIKATERELPVVTMNSKTTRATTRAQSLAKTKPWTRCSRSRSTFQTHLNRTMSISTRMTRFKSRVNFAILFLAILLTFLFLFLFQGIYWRGTHDPVLPEGWVQVTHACGMPLYLHRATRVCTFSRPYFIAQASARV